VSSVRLLTNNPIKVDQLQRFGIDVAAREPLWVGRNGDNERYLMTKAEKLGHFIEDSS
jgi:GTP cyclohydrolase II